MSNQEEIWKDIPGYYGMYKASSFGNIKSYKYKRIKKNKKEVYLSEQILKPGKSKFGYLTVGLTLNKNSHTFYIHRIIAKLFIPNPENKPEVNHIDFNPANNNINNLEWVTSKENKLHSIERMRACKRGEKHHLASITDSTALNIKKDRKCGMKYKQLMLKYNLPEHTIANVCTRNYKHLEKMI